MDNDILHEAKRPLEAALELLLNPARRARQSSPMHPFDGCWGYSLAPMLHAPSIQDAGPKAQETPRANKFAALLAVQCFLQTAIQEQKVLTRGSSHSPASNSLDMHSTSNIAPASAGTSLPDRTGRSGAAVSELNAAKAESEKEIAS